MSVFLKNLYKKWKEFSGTPEAQKYLKWIRRIFLIAVLSFLLYQFYEIGWQKVWSALPSDPIFYLLYIPLFLLIPGSELFIYNILWGTKYRDIWPALLVKKVYNSDVVGYSGEIFLFNWADRSVNKKSVDLMKDVKDNNIISSIISTLATLVVLFVFFKTNTATFNRWFQKIPDNEVWFILISLGVLFLLVYKFRSYIFSLPLNTALKISSIHFIRHCLAFFIQIYQWHIVLPGVPMYVWFTFMAVQLVVTRFPFMPSMDLVILSISIKLTQAMGAPLAAITAIMAVNSVLNKALHLIIYCYYQIFSRDRLEMEQAASSGDFNESGVPAIPEVSGQDS